MSLTDAIRVLNHLKRSRVIRDYALIGAVAATAYMEPMFTEDLDIVVHVDTDEDYLSTFRRVARVADERSGMHLVLGGVPVQMFPSTTKPLYRDAVDKARAMRVGNLRVKVATPEHLILLYLESFRQRDKFRILNLLPKANKRKLRLLLEKFDDDTGKLTKRLQTIR